MSCLCVCNQSLIARKQMSLPEFWLRYNSWGALLPLALQWVVIIFPEMYSAFQRRESRRIPRGPPQDQLRPQRKRLRRKCLLPLECLPPRAQPEAKPPLHRPLKALPAVAARLQRWPLEDPGFQARARPRRVFNRRRQLLPPTNPTAS